MSEAIRDLTQIVALYVGQQNDRIRLDHAPSLPTVLRVDTKRLSAQLEATRLLTAITANLYRSLNPQQRKRADRLLSPLLRELRNADVAAHRLAA